MSGRVSEWQRKVAVYYVSLTIVQHSSIELLATTGTLPPPPSVLSTAECITNLPPLPSLAAYRHSVLPAPSTSSYHTTRQNTNSKHPQNPPLTIRYEYDG